MKKIKLFTHVDLDGIACGVLAKIVMQDVDIEYCGYDTINERVIDFVNSDIISDYDWIYITDISVNEEVAGILDALNRNHKICITLIDHHKTAEWLNNYSWACVVSENESGVKQSGTNLFYNYLISHGYIDRTAKTDEFVEHVRSYDTWNWTITNNQTAKDLHDILTCVGRNEFVEYYSDYLVDHMGCHFYIPQKHEYLLKFKRLEIETYIESKLEQVKVVTVNLHQVAVVVADSNISELGNKICKSIACDYCCMYTGYNLSLRSIGDFDVSAIAKHHDGGGHKNAAGMPVVRSYIDAYLES